MSDLDKAKEEFLTQIGDWTAVGIPRDLFAEWLEPLEAAIRADVKAHKWNHPTAGGLTMCKKCGIPRYNAANTVCAGKVSA